MLGKNQDRTKRGLPQKHKTPHCDGVRNSKEELLANVSFLAFVWPARRASPSESAGSERRYLCFPAEVGD